MPKKYVLVVGGGLSYYEPFSQFGKYTMNQAIFKEPDKIALVLFTGGADICPTLYGHKPSTMTFCTNRRDVYELLSYRRARKINAPIAGVCRGAQFLCAMAGGTLYQHVSGHNNGAHEICTWDGRCFYVTSTHHQMQNPPEDAFILAWSNERLSDIYIGSNDEELPEPDKEYECAYYPSINAIGMQYHPEMMANKSPGFNFASEMISSFLSNEIIV